MKAIAGKMRVDVLQIAEREVTIQVFLCDEKGTALVRFMPYTVAEFGALTMSQVYLLIGAAESYGDLQWHIGIDPDQAEAHVEGG